MLGTTSQLTFSTAPTTAPTAGTSALLPFATVAGTELATYSPSGGLVTYTGNGSGYDTSIAGIAATTDNLKLSANDSVTAATPITTVNSLTVAGTVTLNIAAGQTFTITSGAIFLAPGAALTVTGGGTLAFGPGADAIIYTANAAASFTVNLGTALSGTNLTLAGPGTVNLNGANLFGTGQTTLAGSTLNIATSAALGTGLLTLVSGTIQTATSGGLLLTNALTFDNANVTFAGSNPLLFGGGAATLTAGTNNTLNVTNTAATAFNNTISGAGILTKTGSGTLILSGANTYTGQTFVNAGAILVQNSSGLGSTTAATVVASGAAVQLWGNGLSIANPLVLNGTGINGGGALENLAVGSGLANPWSGTITLQTDSSIGVDIGTTLTVSGVIGGNANFTKVGPGQLTSTAADTYLGNTTITNGVVNVQNSYSLGLSTGASVTVGSGATLQLQASIGNKALTLNGAGFGNVGALPQGALTAQANTPTWGGNVTLNTGTSVAAGSGLTLTISGVVGGTDLTKNGAGTITLLNVNTFTGNLTVNAGTVNLQNTNVYAGATTISGSAIGGAFVGGTLDLSLYGTASNTSSITVNPGSAMIIDNSLANITNRVTGTAPVSLKEASLTYLATNQPGVVSSQSFGALTLAGGQSTITAGYSALPTAGAGGSTVTFLSLIRNPGATANFVGGTGNVSPLGVATNGVLNKVLFGTSGGSYLDGGLTTVNGTLGTFTANGLQYFGNGTSGTTNLVPALEINGGANTGDFATYGANGITAFATYFTQSFAASSTLAGTGPYDVVKVITTAAATLTAQPNQQFGALLLNATGALTFNTNANFQVNSGDYLTIATAAVTIQSSTTSPMVLPGETFVYYNSSGGNTNFLGLITGPGSLVLSGNGTLSLGTSVVNNYSGGTVINAGTVSNGGSANFGSGPITVNGGIFQTTTTNTTLSNALNLSGFLTIPSFSAVIFTGVTTLTANTYLTLSNNLYLNGVVTGPGALIVAAGSATLVLNNANTYTGGTILTSADLQIGNNNALGTGQLTLVSGTINPSFNNGDNIATVVPNNILLPNGSFTIATGIGTQGTNLTFSGNVSVVGANTIAVSNTGQTFFTGTVSGSGLIVLNNAAGIVEFSGSNTNWTGGLTSSAGTLLVTNAASLGTGPLTITGSTTLINNSSTPITLANPLVLSTGPLILGGENAITFTGLTTLLANSTVTVNDTAGATLSGLITDNNGARVLTVNGTGTLTLPNPNDFAGGTILNAGSSTGAGTLILGNGTATGGVSAIQTLTFGGTGLGGTFTLSFNGQATGPIAYSATASTLVANIQSALNALPTIGLTNATPNALVAAGSVAGTINITFQNAFAATAVPTILANGTNLTGTSPTVTAITAMAAAPVFNTSLGTGTITLVTGVLQASAPMTLNNAVSGTANPVAFTGSTLSFNGAYTLGGTLLLTNTTFINGISSGSLTLSNQPLPAGSSTLTNTGNLVFENANSSPNLTINAGTVTVGGTSGALTNANASIVVNTGGMFVLDDSSTANPNPNLLASGIGITLNGGTLTYAGNGNASSTQTLTGNLNLGGGNSTINVNPGQNQGATLTFGSIGTRSQGGVVNFNGANLGGNSGTFSQIVFSTSPTLTNGILPYAFVNGTDFATNGGSGTSMQALSATSPNSSNFATTLPTNGSALSTVNYKLTNFGTQSLTAATQANAILFVGTTVPTVLNLAGNSLTLGAGTLAFSGPQTATVTGGTIPLGTAEGIVLTGPGASANLGSSISGSGGLTFGGTGTTTLSGVNSYSGQTTLNSGTLTLGTANALPPTGSGLNLIGGTLQSNVPLTIANPVMFTNSVVTFGGSNPLTFSGATSLAGTTNLLTVASPNVTFSGLVSGAGNLSKLGAGTLTLTNSRCDQHLHRPDNHQRRLPQASRAAAPRWGNNGADG